MAGAQRPSHARVMLHDDWEVNGDGTGDPQAMMFDPARRLLDLCDRYGARYTFFAEVGQQFAMLDSPVPAHRRAAAEWERVLTDAVSRGHDVQLHFHPQWIGAGWHDRAWKLDFSRWNAGRLPYEELREPLERGKRYLERLLRPHAPDYAVVAYRAGGWMCQPSTTLIRVMRDIGLAADVSVVPGRHIRYGEHGIVDFRSPPSPIVPWVAADDDLARAGDSGIVSIPTYAEPYRGPLSVHLLKQRPLAAAYYGRIFLRWRQKLAAMDYLPRAEPGGDGSDGRSLYLSFGFLHRATLLRMVDNAGRQATAAGRDWHPLIMLTHSKSFYSFRNFEKMLGALTRRPDVSFSRTRDVVLDVAAELTAAAPAGA